MGFRAKSGTEWTGYSLDCYDYWSNCGAENDSFSFMSRYVCPVLVSFLAISATLIVTVSILYWNYSETMYVLIITIITPGTQVPGTQVSVAQQSFSSQVPPCHKKVHGAGPLGQEGTFPCQSVWSMNSKHVKEHKL